MFNYIMKKNKFKPLIIIFILSIIISMLAPYLKDEEDWSENKEIIKSIDNTLKIQSEALENIDVIIHKAFRYDSPRLDNKWEPYKMLWIDIEFKNYKWIDLDDMEVYNADTWEYYGCWGDSALLLDKNWKVVQNDYLWWQEKESLRILMRLWNDDKINNLNIKYWRTKYNNKPISIEDWEFPYPNNNVLNDIKYYYYDFIYWITKSFKKNNYLIINSIGKDYSEVLNLKNNKIDSLGANIEEINFDNNIWGTLSRKWHKGSDRKIYLWIWEGSDVKNIIPFKHKFKKDETIEWLFIVNNHVYIYSDFHVYKLVNNEFIIENNFHKPKWVPYETTWNGEPYTYNKYFHWLVNLPWNKKGFLWDGVLYLYLNWKWVEKEKIWIYEEYNFTTIAWKEWFYFTNNDKLYYLNLNNNNIVDVIPKIENIKAITSWPSNSIIYSQWINKKWNIWWIYFPISNKNININISQINNFSTFKDFEAIYYNEFNGNILFLFGYWIYEISFEKLISLYKIK